MNTIKNLICCLTGLIISSALLNSQIHYNDFYPDIKLQGSLTNIWDSYTLDLNGDSRNDIILTHFYPSDDLFYTEIQSISNRNCDLLVDENDHPLALNEDDIIGPDQSKWLPMTSNAIHVRDNWRGASDKYLALRLYEDDLILYCWIRLDIPVDESYCLLKDCACMMTFNKSIKAGEGRHSNVIMDSPWSINIYPNPASDYINIRLNGTFPNDGFILSEAENLKIYNSIGEYVSSPHALVAEPGVRSDISALLPGVYFLKFGSGTRMFTVIK